MIAGISLQNFRNFKKKTLEFSENITVIVGANAVGKTNILESLYLLSTGKSFKAKVEGEMLRYGQELARVVGVLPTRKAHTAIPPGNNTGAPSVVPPGSRHPSLEALLTRGENGWPKKRVMVNGVPKRLIDFAGIFRTVLFGPWDMDLVTESPSLRRKFLDSVLSQVDREYRRAVLSYDKGLRQRNRLLWRIREEASGPEGLRPGGVSIRSQLLFWNQLLIKNGNYLTGKREEFIDFVNTADRLQTTDYSLEYDRSVISEGRLEQYKNEEIASATTLVGPHRDDFSFRVKGQESERVKERDLAAYGSRGEQRMGILWLKMAELDFIEQAGPEINSGRPTLLLDDIFSELDHEHRDVVMKLAEKQQTIITTADEHFIKGLKGVTISL